MVVAGVARHRALRERLGGVALEVREPAVADGMRDLVAVGVNVGDRDVVAREQVERLLGPVPVGDVRESLAKASRLVALLAAGDRLVVGLEGGGLPGRPGRVGHEAGDARDLLRRKLLLERRHPVAAVSHLPLDARLVRLQLVEVRPDLTLGARRLERVAGPAAGAREHLAARRARSTTRPTAACGEWENRERDRGCGAELQHPVPRYDSPVAVTARPA